MKAAELRARFKPVYTLSEVLDFCVSRAEDSQRAVFDGARWSNELTEALEEEGFTVTTLGGDDKECVIVSWALPAEPIPPEVDPFAMPLPVDPETAAQVEATENS